ncbi:NaeI family type II restriction endonuclease [Kitasatospora sp. GP82]|uniref:NaeI family type II restriction endonuclease n=1 Tax=Kitasatospora sp. GP82 TaxID=3035089 RepID=UPI002473471E|nr:NaeI family type II restriction endonuclease [Kitasatospora sp. GP82]MDH6126183.1 hypothetical protein [Kitasatospora sp. GP82]
MASNPGLFDETEVHTPASAADDAGLKSVRRWFEERSDLEERFGDILRRSIDEVLDGQRTSRYDIGQLEKTEKTYLGTKVEIVARADLDLGRGLRMDYRVADQDVDAKFTVNSNWTIPSEAMGHICLLMSADDRRSRFRVGLLRMSTDLLNDGRNKDGKGTLSTAGRTAIQWLVPDGTLPANLLLGLTDSDRKAIFLPKGGQARTNELFRRVHRQVVDRNTVVTVARQTDSAKRVRDARLDLGREGIIVLGHQSEHPRIAHSLGLPIPAKGSWVAARLAVHHEGDPRPWAKVGDTRYVLYQDGDEHTFAPAAY